MEKKEIVTYQILGRALKFRKVAMGGDVDSGIATEVLETSIVFAIGGDGGDACLFSRNEKVKSATWRAGRMMAQEQHGR